MTTEERDEPQRRPRATLKGRWFVAFAFLLLAIHEAHELAHAVAARVLCGEWPVRDFNAWHLVTECSSWWPTAMGPLFSYAVMLVGGIAAARSPRYRWFGVALLFAANPFARIFTAVMGGGDELVVARRLVGSSAGTMTVRLVVVAFVLAVCGSAIVAGWRSMRGLPGRAWRFAVVLLGPMVVTGVVLFGIGNRMLHAGVLTLPLVGGAPLLVALVSGAAAVMSVVTLRWLTPEARVDRSGS